MNNKSKQYPNPRFSSIEEEDKYWKTHSPLDEGYKGEIQTSEQKRSSFLSVRMAGDELSQLKGEAAKLGLGPSTYARLVLTHAITPQNQPIQFRGGDTNSHTCSHDNKLKPEGICILNTDDVCINRAVISSLLDVVNNTWKCRVLTPNDADYEKVEHLVKSQP